MTVDELKRTKWKYIIMDVTKMNQVHRTPWATTIPEPVGLGHLLSSHKLVMAEIFVRSNKSRQISLTNLPWVMRWDVVL